MMGFYRGGSGPASFAAPVFNRRISNWSAFWCALLSTLLIAAPSTVNGSTKFWDIDTVSQTGAGGSAPSGTWDTGITSDWSTSAVGLGIPTKWFAGDKATFAAGTDATGAYTVTVVGTESLIGLTVEEGTVSQAGGTLDFGATTVAPILLNPGTTWQQDSTSVFAGTGGIALNGGGNLVLRGANTFSKTGSGIQAYLTVSNGTVDFTSDANLGAVPAALDAGALSVNGGTLQYGAASNLSLNANRGITFGTGGGIINLTNSVRLTLPQVAGSGTITKTGFGRLIFQNVAGLFSGKYLVTKGSISATDDLAFGAIPASAQADYFTLNGGMLRMDSGSTPLAINSNRGITLGANGGTLVGPAFGVTYDGVISGSAGGGLTLSYNDALTDVYTGGTTSLGGASTYDGPTHITGITLRVSSLSNGGVSSPIGKSSSAAANLLLDGTLQYVGTGSSTDRSFTISPSPSVIDASGVGNGALAFTSSAPIVMSGSGTHTLTLQGTSTGDNVMGLAIGDQGANKTTVFKQGTGTWVLTNTANSYTNNTAVNEGRLKLGASGVIPDASIITIFSTGGVFDLNGFDETVKSISGGSGSVALGANTLTFANPSGDTYSGVIAGAGGRIVKAGIGKLALTGNNTYTGDTVIQNGTLSISKLYLASGSNVRLSTGGVFDLNFNGADVIHSLFVDGASQATGTWGGMSSAATHKSSFFTGAGMLQVTAQAVLGDYNGNGVVDAADYVVWRSNLGGSTALPNDNGLGTPVGQAQYNLWRSHFGSTSGSGVETFDGASVPEPAVNMLILIGAAIVFARRWS